MKWFSLAWAFFNGKKMTIGSLLMLVPTILSLLGVSAEWGDMVQKILNIILASGAVVTTVGTGHKVVKGKMVG